jgi:hypothetical protein
VGGDDVDALAAVVGKGWAKGESAIPVRGPSVVVVGTGKGKTELAGGVKGVGGEVVWEMVQSRPGRESGIRAPGTQDVEGDLGKGEETVPEVVRKVRVGG